MGNYFLIENDDGYCLSEDENKEEAVFISVQWMIEEQMGNKQAFDWHHVEGGFDLHVREMTDKGDILTSEIIAIDWEKEPFSDARWTVRLLKNKAA